MPNDQHLGILLQGEKAWNKWRKANAKAIPDLSQADLHGEDLSWADLHKVNLQKANLRSAKLRGASLRGADLSKATLCNADLGNADLTRASFIGADLSASVLYQANLVEANLSGAKLEKASLEQTNLTGALLISASLTMTSISKAFLDHANLNKAVLHGAFLSKVSLNEADLSEADFESASLVEVNFNGANFRKTNFRLATFGGSIFSNTTFVTATGLDACRFLGPNIIDYGVLAQSGTLPLSFLRGCGLPDTLIEYLPSIMSLPIQFYSCFISYSTIDQEFADRLYADLQNKGVRCWFAAHDIQGGKKMHEQIDEAIRVYDRLLLILSPASMDSEWVKTEIAKARKRELQEERRMLFPVRLVEYEALKQWECFDGDTGKDSAREIREYYVPDFSNWKDHDTYQREFANLLRDLEADAKFLPVR